MSLLISLLHVISSNLHLFELTLTGTSFLPRRLGVLLAAVLTSLLETAILIQLVCAVAMQVVFLDCLTVSCHHKLDILSYATFVRAVSCV